MIAKIGKYRIVLFVTLTLLILTLFLYVFKFDNRKGQTSDLDNEIIYGEMLTWAQVNKVFPKFAKATVIDVDTRMSFQVQRRGGSSHADVQPLTADDTLIMKTIYDGKWSWKRKAVIIQLDNGKRIAASMNGMPHGQGAIKDNNFNGHSCIHFKDCKTHGSNKVDLAHQMMIWKAGNKLDEQLQKLVPEDIIKVFITAVDQHELNIAGRLLDSKSEVEPLLKSLEIISNIKADKINNTEGNTFNVDIKVIYNDSNREFRKNLIIKTTEQKPYWKIDADSLMSLFDKNTWTALRQISNNAPDDEDLEVDVVIE